MIRSALILPVFFAIAALTMAETSLPSLHDGIVITGPGHFLHQGELLVQGNVTLKNLTLDLHGPIRVAAGATLELDAVTLMVSDSPV